ncbi:MAG: hypothetical protein K9L95_06205 [Candidatus Omnitrophica bacterium]|nr:hypothetical protein [Candidatus Omnitrophota bacterium]
MDHEKQSEISCSTFKKQEPVIKDITDKINKAKGTGEKAEFAEKLQEEVEVLLSCPDYKAEDFSCKSCRFIAKLRKRIAETVIKTRKLE